MESAQEFDIYSFINSRDVAEHCRNIRHYFSTIEMAKLIYISRLSDAAKLQGYKWLIKNAPDEPIPDIRLHIPYFALGSGCYTKEEVRSHTKVYKGRKSVLSYLSECTKSGNFIDLQDDYNTLKSINIHIPHPFKVGEILKHMATRETYVVERISDVLKIDGRKSRSQFCLWLKRQGEESKHNYITSIEVSDLHYSSSLTPISKVNNNG